MAKKAGQKRLSRSLFGNIVLNAFLIIFAAFFALPLVYAIVNSFKPIDELFIFPPRFFVSNPTFGNFTNMFALMSSSTIPFLRYFLNSAFITVVITLGYIVISSAAAYPLAKGNFYGKDILFKFVVTALIFSTSVTGIQLYIIVSKLGLIDTYWSIILPALSGSYGVFLMKQFMEGIPDSLIEAAEIDGCSSMKILTKIVLPNVKPAWLTLAIFSFQSSWNTAGSGFIFTEELKFLPTAMREISSGGAISRAGVASATSVVLMLPPILFFILSQSRVMETMANAGIKE